MYHAEIRRISSQAPFQEPPEHFVNYIESAFQHYSLDQGYACAIEIINKSSDRTLSELHFGYHSTSQQLLRTQGKLNLLRNLDAYTRNPYVSGNTIQHITGYIPIGIISRILIQHCDYHTPEHSSIELARYENYTFLPDSLHQWLLERCQLCTLKGGLQTNFGYRRTGVFTLRIAFDSGNEDVDLWFAAHLIKLYAQDLRRQYEQELEFPFAEFRTAPLLDIYLEQPVPTI